MDNGITLELGDDEDTSDGLKRLIVELCRDAVDVIRRADDDEKRHAAVHNLRKALKKVRACLRLVRDRVDGDRELNDYYRDLARPVSATRDATANIETLDKLTLRYADALGDDGFEALSSGLLARRAELAERDFRRRDLLAEIARELDVSTPAVAGWPLNVRSFDDIRPGVKRVYRRGRKAFARARDGGSARDFHEWRKRVKDLQYQLEILKRLWPDYLAVLSGELYQLADELGSLHDLDVLRAAIDEIGLAEDEALRFEELARREQERLTGVTLLRGRRCYRASPKAFCDSLADYWSTWQAGLRNETAPPP